MSLGEIEVTVMKDDEESGMFYLFFDRFPDNVDEMPQSAIVLPIKNVWRAEEKCSNIRLSIEKMRDLHSQIGAALNEVLGREQLDTGRNNGNSVASGG